MPDSLHRSIGRRRASADDLPFLLALREEAMGRYLRAAGLPATTAAHRARIAQRFDCIEIITRDGCPVGMLKLLRAEGCWQLLQFQVAAGARGGGLGRRILDQLIAEAAADGADLSLHVLRDNPARHLYERAGFRVVGQDRHEFHLHRPR